MEDRAEPEGRGATVPRDPEPGGHPLRLHLVDGTYELFRAHHAPGPTRTDPAGRDVKATVGVVSTLLRLLHDDDEAVTHLAVAFDHPITSWRNRELASYKDGADTDPALLAQFDRVEDAVAALGVTVWPQDEYEADDVLASAALRYSPDVDEVRILTPDKDLAQVVGDRVVQVDRARGRVLDAEAVRERMGVAPESVPDLLALTGDAADGIPGIPGFGAKTAATLLARYPHLEDIPADPAEWDVTVRGAARLGERLQAERDRALAYRRLTRLVTDLELPDDVEVLRFDGVPRERYLAWCDEVGVNQLRDRPRRWA